MTDWPPTGGNPPTDSTGGSSGGHPPTSPAWSVPPSTTGGATGTASSTGGHTTGNTTGNTPVSSGGISSPSKRVPFGARLPREARLAITVVAALLIIGLVIGLVFWTTSGSDDSDDPEAVVPPVVTTTVAPTTTTEPPPAVSVLPPPPPPPTVTAIIAPTTTETPGGYDPDALGPAVPLEVAGFPSQQRWAAMRQCQTGGSYTEVNDAGTHHGAYQFRPETWDELAGRNYPSLVGVLPSQASPADQDRMAYALWQEFGSGRWPGCRHTLDGTAAPTPTTTATPTITTTTPATTTTTAAPTTTTTSPPGGRPPSPPTIILPGVADRSVLSTTTVPTTTTAAPRLPTAAQWQQLRQCESNGDYTIRSANGLYYGAYQFNISTWNDIARRYASRLVGVLPSVASPQDQDFLAQKLWDDRGRAPWPVCGVRHLPENPNL